MISGGVTEAQITKLKKQAKPVIKHHKAYLKSVSLKQRFPRKSFSKKRRVHKEYVSKQWRKFAKGKSSVQRDPLFDEIPEDTVDHMETENAQNEGRTREMVDEDKKSDLVRTYLVLKIYLVLTRRLVRTYLVLKMYLVLTRRELVLTWRKLVLNRPIVSTDGSKVSTDRQIEGTDEQIKSTDEQRKEIRGHQEQTSYKESTEKSQKTYLKACKETKHSELKTKKFEEIQALYEKINRSDEDFISIGFAEDERQIKRMNEKGIDSSKSEVSRRESKEEVHDESKEEESTRKWRKENDELRLHLTIALDEEKEVDYEILDRKYPIKEWKTECLGTKPQADKAEHLEEINQNVVIRSNGQKRYFSTLMRYLGRFDGVMFNPDDEDEFWNSQQDWNIVSWKLHGSSGVHTLVTETGLVIHMLVEKKYPLRKKVLVQMLKLKLKSEEDNTMALELIRFIKKVTGRVEPKDFD
ncbi:hypothetical protein Tco_0759236 [Tanacetum coccineum]